MEKRSFLLLKTLLLLVAITESAVILPRKRSHVPDIGQDKKLEPSPEIRNPGRGSYDSSSVEYDDINPSEQPSDYDYKRPGENDGNEPGVKPEIFPEYEDEITNKGDGPSKPGDEENFEPFDGEDSDKAEDDEDNEDEESKPSTDEYDESKPSSDEDNELTPSTLETDEKLPDEIIDDGGTAPEEEENKDKGPDEESDEHDDNDKNPDNDNRNEKESEHFFGGSIFDTPFFNLNKVRKYFNQMERALGQVFHQVLDEARLLNGTYANTTEEEINIGGRKYVVQKSIIKGADNHSSIYVESLSTKPKLGVLAIVRHANFAPGEGRCVFLKQLLSWSHFMVYFVIKGVERKSDTKE